MTSTTITPEAPALPPVKMSGAAHDALVSHMRRWSGWDKARVTFGVPTGSPYAHTNKAEGSFTVNVDALLLNPNRVLLRVNPFRLRQEAVLTGAMLHEAGHARYSNWLPSTPEQAAAKPTLHSDGADVAQATISLAVLMEEARVEGLMSRDATDVGCVDLDWTMRAMAAMVLPTTRLTISDPNVAMMELIDSWAKRAGRQIALHHWKMEAYKAGRRMNQSAPELPAWVNEFTSLLTGVVADHLMSIEPEPVDEEIQDGDVSPDRGYSVTLKTQVVLNTLRNMTWCEDSDGPEMLDRARTVLTILFPETPPEDMPQAGGGCGSCAMPEPDESEDGEGEATSGDESDEQGEGGTEGQSEGEDAGDGQEGGSGEASETGGDDGEGKPSPGATAAEKAMAEALAALEKQAQAEAKTEAKIMVEQSPADADPNIRGAGGSDGTAVDGGWRKPRPPERDTARNASKFLRDLIDSTETTIRSLTDSPAAQVDGAELAAWKAGGQRRDPHFFVRTRREVVPAPPVKIAVLVDVSQSMGVLQKPSALLSWALANAAIDLRNFAGRGQNVESCLIHWGNTARVVQSNGGSLPGLREVVCKEGTHAMGAALELVESEMPGFLTPSEKPENRLIVQFTDWDLFGRHDVVAPLERALAAGVNMLTIGPPGYHQRSDLPWLLGQIRSTTLPGRSHEVVYNKMFPEAVWDEAARMLR